jgi:NADPH-dependent 2,4-dienoyl-CoA reductase/sulfur reductase-like enzyme
MWKKTIQTLEQKFTSSSSRTCDVHMKWNNIFSNWVRNISSNTEKETTTSYSVPREKVDCIVIGAGVVGIAVARALALKGREVIVIESAPSFGTGTSSRNSEVVHAGIYYPRDSFKVGVSFCY